MIDGKKWWASRTIWSAVGILIMVALQAFGVAAGDGDASVIGDGLGDVVVGALALFSIYARLSATHRIGSGGDDGQ